MAKINRWPGTLDPSGSLKVTSEKFSAKEKCKRLVWIELESGKLEVEMVEVEMEEVEVEVTLCLSKVQLGDEMLHTGAAVPPILGHPPPV